MATYKLSYQPGWVPDAIDITQDDNFVVSGTVALTTEGDILFASTELTIVLRPGLVRATLLQGNNILNEADYQIDDAGNIIPPQTNEGFDEKLDTIIANIGTPTDTNLATDIANLDTTLDTHDVDIKALLGTPTDTNLATDIANLDTTLDTHDVDIKALLGTPINGSISDDIFDVEQKVSAINNQDVLSTLGVPNVTIAADIAAVDTKLGSHDTDVKTLIGVPTDTNLATDIANVQTSISAVDNSDVLAILGTPVDTNLSTDIANVQTSVTAISSSTDEIQYIPRADEALVRGAPVWWRMGDWATTGSDKDNVQVSYDKVT